MQQLCSLYLHKEVENSPPYQNLHMGIYSSFIHNGQNLDTTKMFFSRWMDSQIIEYYAVLKSYEAVRL